MSHCFYLICALLPHQQGVKSLHPFFFFFKHSAKNEPETKLRLGIGPEVEFVLTEHDTSSPRIPPVPAMEALWSEGYDQSL